MLASKLISELNEALLEYGDRKVMLIIDTNDSPERRYFGSSNMIVTPLSREADPSGRKEELIKILARD